MRRQITWLVALTTTAIVFSFMIPLGLLVRTLAQDRAMAMADQEARSIAVIVSGLHDQPQLATQVQLADNRLPARTSVLMPSGRVLGSPYAGMAADPEVRRALASEAFSVIDGEGGRVYVPVIVEDGTIVVRTTVAPDQLWDGVAVAWAMIGGLSLVLTVLALLVASRLGRSVSEPLRRVAETAHRLREGDLGARAPVTGTEETVELAEALNGLAGRITGLLVAERSAVGDLAHRLRTPVTALRLEAETVQPPEKADRLGQLVVAVQSGIDAVVREARRGVREDLSAGCDLRAVVAERVGYWEALAEDQGRSLRVSLGAGPAPVSLSALDVADVVDVLIDNVFAHTQEGVGFAIDLQRRSGAEELTIADDGPGFGPRRADKPGYTGLGLDIVRRTVAGAGGSVVTSAPGERGARVVVRIPPAT